MSKEVAFEVQAYKDGNWTIDSVAGDRDQAIYEAQRLIQTSHIWAVRVVQESFHEASNSFVSKIVFKRSKVQNPPSGSPATSAASTQAASQERAPPPRDFAPSRHRHPADKKGIGFLPLLFVFFGITLAGIGMVLLLRQLSESL